ncbi:tetratricopeptide repeat protein [Streptomyces sp. R21]|uniref:Tetratricopeptide repeat protein n=1 Tax=Streptomyces sp. R21 TaxID=3238627 RepID=A0AB39P5X4_9ACTN
MTNGYDGDHLDFRGGKFTGPFTAKAEYHEHGPAPTALDALPMRVGGFTGRDDELRMLLDALDPSAYGAPEAVVVTAVSGLGGIGKTALAVEAAHQACARGWFPGGVLFIDLHGYDYNEESVSAEQALEALLRALGTASQHIPTRVDDRAALYRSALAQRARERGPMLVLADNVGLAEQVRFLLPGGGANHRLLVTSRERLPQHGARLLPLDELTSESAYDLLDRALRLANPYDNRIRYERVAAEELAALCGYLPLALQLAVARLALDRSKPVAELTAELAESWDRLDLDDGERSVRAAFDLSYRRLPSEQTRLLGLLALAPGPEVTTQVINALVGAETPPVRALDALARAHLIEQGTKRGRWRLHDLVRAFGISVVNGDTALAQEGEAARSRVLSFFCRWAEEADARLRWLAGMPESELFADRAAALAWLDEERAGLVAAVQWAQEERYAAAAVRLAELLAVYLDWRRHFDDLIVVSSAAQEAAKHAMNHRSEAAAWSNLGNALGGAGRVQDAIDALTRARECYQRADDRHGEAIALSSLGAALRDAGNAAEAIDALNRALALYQFGAGDRHREAIAWTTLGLALAQDGRPEAAINAHTRSQDLFQAAGDRHREGIASNNLGSALMQAGRVENAIVSYCRALEIYQEFEDWYRTGRTLENLARAHLVAGTRGQSHQCWLRAGQAFTQADAPDRAASAFAEADAIIAPSPAKVPAVVDAPDPASKAAPAETGWGYPHGPLPLQLPPGGPQVISGPSIYLPLDRTAERETSAQSSGDQEVEHQHGS